MYVYYCMFVRARVFVCNTVINTHKQHSTDSLIHACNTVHYSSILLLLLLL